jgi:glycosyltransferase involved in cell wall biosynthesis
MRLLILTQKVDKNDAILGFFHDWLVAFAQRCDFLTVIALSVGEHTLPNNVRVYSLGKEKGAGKIERLIRFYELLFETLPRFDSVFVHMNPIYVVLGGLLWRLNGKQVSLWYTHRSVDMKLRIATLLSHLIFTASPEGCRVGGHKVHAVGHGIDVARFSGALRAHFPGEGASIRILHVGRITPIKNCDTLLKATRALKTKLSRRFSVTFVGAPSTQADEVYATKLADVVKSENLEDTVGFTGAVRNIDMPPLYATADLTVNLAPTGGLDKAVLESMAAGIPVLVSNEAYRSILGIDADVLMFPERDTDTLAIRIQNLIDQGTLSIVGKRLRERVAPFTVQAITKTIVTMLDKTR